MEIVSFDLNRYLDRIARQDSLHDSIQDESDRIEEQYLSDPRMFAEITECLYHDDRVWPIESLVIQLILAFRRHDHNEVLMIAEDIKDLFEMRLKRHSKNIATSKIALRRMQDE